MLNSGIQKKSGKANDTYRSSSLKRILPNAKGTPNAKRTRICNLVNRVSIDPSSQGGSLLSTLSDKHFEKLGIKDGDLENIKKLDALENRIGMLFFKGNDGFEKNQEKAFEWFRVAAQNNNPKAMGNLSYCFKKGIGIERNSREAAFWRRELAQCNTANLSHCI